MQVLSDRQIEEVVRVLQDTDPEAFTLVDAVQRAGYGREEISKESRMMIFGQMFTCSKCSTRKSVDCIDGVEDNTCEECANI